MDDKGRDCGIQKTKEAQAKEFGRAIIFCLLFIPLRIIDRTIFHLACFKKERCLTRILAKRIEEIFIPQLGNTDIYSCACLYTKVTGYIFAVLINSREVEIFVDADQYQRLSVGEIVRVKYRQGFLGLKASII
jgi:hypothetical protein